MKYTIQEKQTGIDISVTGAENARRELLEAFRACQEGRCSCPTEEYKKLDTLEVAQSETGLELRLKAREGEAFDSAEIKKCLKHTAEQVKPAKIKEGSASMHPRARSLIAELGLQPHPEGGYYREIYRSGSTLRPGDHRDERSALTAIYFLLTAGQHSAWHQVISDEVWSHLEGDALELLSFDAGSSHASTIELGRFCAGGAGPIHVIPAGVWQAARPLGEYALLGCYVAPGFDFCDFRMASDDAEMCRIISQQGETFTSCL